MNQFTVRTDFLALEATNAGEHIWRAIELMPEVSDARRVRAFEVALEVICEEIGCTFTRKLFSATAMQALPVVLLSAAQRKQISNEAMDAWQAYVDFLRAEQAEDAADHYRELERDAQLLGDAA